MRTRTGRRIHTSDSERRPGPERSYGEFFRRFSLPSSVDADGITAEMKDGVLTVRLPKTERATGRKIELGGS